MPCEYVKNTIEGGIAIAGGNERGRVYARFDAQGRLVEQRCTFQPVDATEAILIERRAAICEWCEHCDGVSRVVKGRAVNTVKCRQCGCGGLSLAKGECPLKKWPVAGGQGPGGGGDV